MRELLIFVKAPRVGEVKTRLAAVIGAPLATEVYRTLATAVLEATRPNAVGEFARVICFTPADRLGEVAAWVKGETLLAQVSGDLGQRMDQAFAASFDRGSESSVIIGTDALAVDHAAVVSAFSALDTADVVLRAARDGGYTLIGLKKRQSSLFGDIPWSTGEVLAKTLARAATAGLEVVVQGPDTDIDTADDLRAQLEVLRPHLGPELAARVRTALGGPPAGAFSTPDA